MYYKPWSRPVYLNPQNYQLQTYRSIDPAPTKIDTRVVGAYFEYMKTNNYDKLEEYVNQRINEMKLKINCVFFHFNGPNGWKFNPLIYVNDENSSLYNGTWVYFDANGDSENYDLEIPERVGINEIQPWWVIISESLSDEGAFTNPVTLTFSILKANYDCRGFTINRNNNLDIFDRSAKGFYIFHYDGWYANPLPTCTPENCLLKSTEYFEHFEPGYQTPDPSMISQKCDNFILAEEMAGKDLNWLIYKGSAINVDLLDDNWFRLMSSINK